MKRRGPDRVQAVRRVAADIDRRLDPDVAIEVDDETRALYRTMNTQALATLRQAFELDRDEPGKSTRARAFCNGRIEAIDAILVERGVTVRPWFTPALAGTPHDAGFDERGRVLQLGPGEARARVLEMFDDPESELVAVVLRHRGELGVYVMGAPSRELLQDLESATAAYRRIIQQH